MLIFPFAMGLSLLIFLCFIVYPSFIASGEDEDLFSSLMCASFCLVPLEVLHIVTLHSLLLFCFMFLSVGFLCSISTK